MLSRIFYQSLLTLVLLGFGFLPAVHAAGQTHTIDVTIKNHQFSPAEIHVASGQPTILNIRNKDGSVEEFESHDLNVEKIIVGHGQTKVRLRPLEPGRYSFMGEFHADTAQGVVIAE